MTPQDQIKMLREACQSALQCHGVTLASYPPQDAWTYHRVSEKLSAALVTSLPAQPVAEGYEELTDDQIFNFWLFRDCMAAIQCGDIRAQFISAVRALLASGHPSLADRAQLAERVAVLEAVIGILREYPDFDDEPNALATMMDEALSGKRPALIDTVDALAAGRMPTPQPHADEAAKTECSAIEVGDTVVCTDVSGFDMRHLTEGQEYAVAWLQGADIKLVDVEYMTKLWRFKKVAPPSPAEDKT